MIRVSYNLLQRQQIKPITSIIFIISLLLAKCKQLTEQLVVGSIIDLVARDQVWLLHDNFRWVVLDITIIDEATVIADPIHDLLDLLVYEELVDFCLVLKSGEETWVAQPILCLPSFLDSCVDRRILLEHIHIWHIRC